MKKNYPIKGHPSDPIQWAKVEKNEWAGGLQRPGFDGDAGFDLCASRQVTIPSNGFGRIPTNVKVAIPVGKWGLLVGRSSTFFKRRLLVQTAVIDGGYRGELWFVVKNMSGKNVTVKRGERLSQLILMPLITPEVTEVKDLPPSDRGESGFGSTGIEAELDG